MTDKKEYIKDLLIRLNDQSLRPGLELPEGTGASSKLTVSHTAREEINDLCDEAYIPVFQELLSTEKITRDKYNLVIYLIRLADKFKRNDVADYIIGLVKVEKTREFKSAALAELRRSGLKLENEKEAVFDLAAHKDWQIRFDALGLLSKFPKIFHKRIEALCIDQAEQYRSQHHSLRVIASTLSNVGTSKSIQTLKNIVELSKNSDTIWSAVHAIDKINGMAELDYFVECYGRKKNTYVKSKLIQSISKYGNERHSDLMLSRAKSLLARKRKTNTIYANVQQSELVTIVKFLDTYSTSKSTTLLAFISEKKIESLDETEATWIKARIGQA